MPRRIDQLPTDATTVARRVAALEREMRELRASRRMSNAAVSGGDTTITGARIQTASDGARAVLDANEGALMVYDADDNLTNKVGGPENVIFNQAGFPDGEWVAMNVGNLLLGVGNATQIDQSRCGAIAVLGTGFGISLASASDATTFTEQAFVNMLAGTVSGTPGTVDYPTAQVKGDLGVTSAVVKLTSTFDTTAWRQVPATWQTPTWGSGWSGTTTLNGMGGFRSLQARLMAEDDVWIVGGATTTGTSGSIGTLPAEMWPPAGGRVLMDAYFFKPGTPGTVSMGKVQITEAGVVNASQSLGGIAISSGVQVFINGRYPLGNLA